MAAIRLPSLEDPIAFPRAHAVWTPDCELIIELCEVRETMAKRNGCPKLCFKDQELVTEKTTPVLKLPASRKPACNRKLEAAIRTQERSWIEIVETLI
jgi:hypothetical protein